MKYKIIISILTLGMLFLGFSTPKPKDSIHLKQFNYPVLKGKDNNPVLRICYVNNSKKKTLKNIKINLSGTHISDLAEARVFFTGKDSVFKDKVQYGKTLGTFNELIFSGSKTLSKGNNYIWLSYKLSEDCNLTGKVDAGLDYLTVNNKKISAKEISPKGKLRTGIAVRKSRDDGVHTYRIPGLTTSLKGTL